MSHDVSSWYWEQAGKSSPPVTPLNMFYIGSTDYSDHVIVWPELEIEGINVRPGLAEIQLANQDGTFNFFTNSKITLTNLCGIDIGFTSVASHDPEYELMYQGYIDHYGSENEVVTLTISDRMRQLTQRTVGTKDTPAVFSSTIMLGSDIFWTVCTCYAGLDSTQSTANIDIDWDAFQAWAAVFSADNLIMGAEFKGAKCIEALSKLSRHTHSTISTNGILIAPKRFIVNSENQATLDDSNIFGVSVSLTDKTIINRQYIQALYVPDSRDWGIEVLAQSSDSVNSYGLKEQREKDSAIWYTNSASAINFSQRVTTLNKDPNEKFNIQTGLVGGLLHIGDIISVTNTPQVIQGVTSRVMGRTIDMNTGVVNLQADTAFIFNQFILDVSTLDGPETLN